MQVSESQKLNQFERQIEQCRTGDIPELSQCLRGLRQRLKQKRPIDRGLIKLQQSIQESLDWVLTRHQLCPEIDFPEELPICQKLADLAELIVKHPVVIVAGETGSGKTTQLPKLCLKLGRGRQGLIGHTQPRRIAARAVASRIAEELKTELGQAVGYKIRFDDQIQESSYLQLMTDGILLSEMAFDPELRAFDTLIIDEAHERSLNIDFILGYIKKLLPKRPDLKVIITSATIDLQRFSKHFNNAPILEVSGRTFPVETRYRPLVIEQLSMGEGMDEPKTISHSIEPYDAMLQAIEELCSEGSGDILVFLAGEREIREASETIRKHLQGQVEVLPLYSRLSRSEQDKVFKSHNKRRIVLATNVAETSLTVPNIRYVIDFGFARISRYSQRTKVQRLPIEPISKASAEQRKGRCGRLSDGICIRLYSQDDYESRPDFTDPEIYRTNLAAVILQMLNLKMGEIEDFPFIELPEQKQINDGYRLLQNLQAIDQQKRITALGRQLARLPIDPRLGRMLLAAEQYLCVKEMLIIASALSVQDIRERPLEKRSQADQWHLRFNQQPSDFSSLVQLWDYVHQLKADLSSSQFKKQLKSEFLSYVRLRDWQDTYRQLTRILKEAGLRTTANPGDYASIHKAIITGLPEQLGHKTSEGDYEGTRQSRFVLQKTSAVNKKAIHQNRDVETEELSTQQSSEVGLEGGATTKSAAQIRYPSKEWIVAAELVETQRLFASTVASIDSQWVVEVVPHLINTKYSEPQWRQKTGFVVARMQQSILGLILVADKWVSYEKIDAKFCRQCFLEQGLIQRQLKTRISEVHAFWKALDTVIEQENKVRRRDRLLDNTQLLALLERKIPAHILSAKALEKWYKKANTQDRKQLIIEPSELLKQEANQLPELPNFWSVGRSKLPMSYRFEPGHEEDGVCIKVPLSLLSSISMAEFEYSIPYLLRDKMIALIKGLPKRIRKHFIPAPDFADALLARIDTSKERLYPAMVKHLQQMTGVSVSVEEFMQIELPNHLNILFDVVDGSGKTLAKSRDLFELQQKAKNQNWKIGKAPKTQKSTFENLSNLTQWPEMDLLKCIETSHSGIVIKQWPALMDEGQSAAVRLVDNQQQAQYLTQQGAIRLLFLEQVEAFKYCLKKLPQKNSLSLSYAPLGSWDNLVEQLFLHVIQAEVGSLIINAASQFKKVSQKLTSSLVLQVTELSTEVDTLLKQVSQLRRTLKKSMTPLALASYKDIQQQIDALFYKGFLLEVSPERLKQYPRYLKSLNNRLEKLPHSSNKERSSIEVLNSWDQKVHQIKNAMHQWQPEWMHYEKLCWMLLELRVSLFSQELGTPWPISEKRLQKHYQDLIDSLH